MCIPFGIQMGILPSNTPIPTAPQQPMVPPLPEMIQLCENDEFKRGVIQDMERLAKLDKLRGFEFVKNIFLSPRMFSVENGLLTPTFKIKRMEAKVELLFSN